MNSGTVSIGGLTWTTWFATTAAEISDGLSGWTDLPGGYGMFFVLPSRQVVTVTTVPMLFDLDIAFVKDGAVTQIAQNVTPGNLVTSEESADAFFEVNAGDLDGIMVGDTVSVVGLPDVAPQADVLSAMMPMIMMIMMMAIIMPMMKSATEEKVYGCSASVIDGSVMHFQTEIDEAFRQAITRANRR